MTRVPKAWATAATAILVARSSSRKNNKHSSTKPSMSLQPMAVCWGREDWSQRSPLEREPNGRQGPPPTELGVSQAAQLLPASAASAPRQSRSCRPRSLKKTFPEHLKALQQAFPHATVELWAIDRHRVGLKPTLRRVRVRKGSRPRVAVQHRLQWLYLY